MARTAKPTDSALAPGKLPHALLRSCFAYRGHPDRLVLIGPRVGEDAAVINLGDQCLVLKSDPITFATDSVGWYAVHVNANDVAVMGAQPRWFQTTLIVPPGTRAAAVRAIFRDVHLAARALKIAVTGGHTEVSAAVTQPVIAGDMQGVVARDRLVTSEGARPGDAVLLTKSAAIEGTAILAQNHAAAAARILGARARRYAARFHRRPGISVVAEALVAARLGASAMHDPTEGGIATGLHELSFSSRTRLTIDCDRIPVHPLTQRLCHHFGVDPLHLIASGSLLAAVPAARVAAVLRHMRHRGIAVTVVGQVDRGRGVLARRDGKRVPLPWSEQDELARLG